ncbi:hypothetical protein ACIQWA_13580 [Kitasatospora sp. NPDC098652]|uniref:hypothetical protein n=1 Tax=Kitasatospora sp. NPDC098652 TaxID=3364095 RepID=UPI0037FB5F05
MRIRLPDRRDPGRWRRRLPAIALVWSVVVALGVVPIGLGAGPQAVAESSTVTVPGPKVLDPVTGTRGRAGKITVSQTKNLVNQVVQVSWSGFTPTKTTSGQQVTLARVGEAKYLYPVRIYECRGTTPKVTDCYNSSLYGGDAKAGFQQTLPPGSSTAPDFPSNMAIAPTGADGTGAANIELYTQAQAPTLGCDDTHPCSLVVEANYGGDSLGRTTPTASVDCLNHSLDSSSSLASDAALFSYAANGMSSGEQCAWENGIVIPLSFAPVAQACASQNGSFDAEGLEMFNRAMQQWRAGLCLSDSPLAVRYVSAGGEPQARSRFLGGSTDVALTARADGSPPARPYVYAPLATSGISVVFSVDDQDTGRQIRDMKLDARLMAKLLTQSYAPRGGVVTSVKGNPTCLFADPEFLQLNQLPATSGLKWPRFCDMFDFSPTVVGGTTDLTYQLTSWIASDPDAARFLDGESDPWGMHVNTYYLRPAFSGYPVDSFSRQDSSGIVGSKVDAYQHLMQYEWNPVTSGLGQVARGFLQNKATCVNPGLNGTGGHDQCAPVDVGQRMLIAIMDTGQAKAYSLPEAQLLNPAGAFVSPGTTGFQAAVADMTVDASTGVQSLPYGTADTAYSRDQRAYPLTTVQYAMVPTQGVPAAKAAAITTFLRTTTTSGQVYGTEPGHLAPGFLALTSAQRAQAADAATHVEAQDAKLPGNQAAPPNPPAVTPGDGGTGGGTPAEGPGSGSAGGTTPVSAGTDNGTSGGGLGGASTGGLGEGAATTGGAAAAAAAAGGKTPGASPSTPGKSLSAAPVAAGTPAADRSGTARLLLPIALIGGLVLLVGGPAALILGGTPAGERTLAGLRSGWSRLRRRP